MKHLFITLLFFLTFRVTFSQDIFIGNSYRIYPSSVTQTEPVICVHPTNPLFLFASSVTINTANGFRSEGIYLSTNGGLNWFGTDTCTGENILNHGGDPGVVINNNGNLILTHIGSIFYGVYSHYSTNNGLNWSSAYVITTQQVEDKGTTTSDKILTSLYYGRAYTAFVQFVSPFPVMVSYTTNGGLSWTIPQAINSPPPKRCSGGEIKVGLNGRVYVSWAGVTSTIPYTEDYIGLAYSDNGGVNWTVNQNIYDVNGINGTLPSKNNIRVNGLPRMDIDLTGGTRNGWIYIVTTEKNLPPAGSDPDIILHYSSNGGSTWSQGIRVNQDSLNNGKIQYFPAIKIDNTGAINIIYYDDRNTTSDSVEVFLSRSTNGGATWQEYPISGHRFKPKQITGGPSSYQGDFISLEFTNGKLIPLWMDDYSGIYQIWTVPIDINYFAIKKNPEIHLQDDFKLTKCYPNPFNSSLKIEFEVRKTNNYTFEIYNTNGEIILKLFEGILTPGINIINWYAPNIPSGVYFLIVKYEGTLKTEKVVLIK
ncbi:MAG: T9SS type A sorting domain-containing protein [Ignavibacteria bacterium]|nr:T9SS type A sorting domain-containing protein [Ignavibacteria bacterium]